MQMGTDAPARLAFEKYEGLGNDFLVIDALNDSDISAERALALCDRHFGIGADGVLLALPPRSPDADARMLVLNADGSIPEMCGNGARCVALHLARTRGLHEGVVRLETTAGMRACAIFDRDGQGLVTVDMGRIVVTGDRAVDLGTESKTVTIADAGNPHAVLFGAFSREEVERLGSRLTRHVDFPNGTNVEFARVTGAGIDLVVWERGVGVTLACGTGACAAAAVACSKGLAAYEAPILVTLPGGTLEILVARDGRASMRGPAKHVFSGVTRAG